MVSGEEDRKQSEKACPPQSADRASSAERRAAKKEAIKAFLTQRISEQASLLDFNVDASATEKAEEARIQCGVYEAKFGQLTFQDVTDSSISSSEMITSCMKERLPEIEAWRKRKQTAESIEGEAEKEEEEEGGDDDNSRRNGHLRLGNGLSAAEELVSLKLALTRLQAASLMDEVDHKESEPVETALTCERTIAQVQRKCLEKLGAIKMDQAQAYLRKRRIEEGGKAGEMDILFGLRQICPDPKFGFLLEYLNFLEHVKTTP